MVVVVVVSKSVLTSRVHCRLSYVKRKKEKKYIFLYIICYCVRTTLVLSHVHQHLYNYTLKIPASTVSREKTTHTVGQDCVSIADFAVGPTASG